MPLRPSGPFAPPRDWDALRRAYEADPRSLALIAAENRLQEETLKRYAKERMWSRGVPDTAEPAAKPKRVAAARASSPRKRPSTATTKPRAPPKPPPPTLEAPPDNAELAVRLRRMLRLSIDDLEREMETLPKTSAERERRNRSLGAMVKNLESINDLPAAETSTGTERGKPAAAPEAAGSDEEQLRRELAARIQRLREKLGG